MSNSLAETSRITAEEYLAMEEQAEQKQEYVDGEIFAMDGARQEHVLVSLNIASAFKLLLRGKPCRSYISDMKLHLRERQNYYYPDVMVSCSPDDFNRQQAIEEPTLIVEVLSESTASYDRDGKFLAYQTIDSLQEYWLIDISQHQVETYRRADGGDWIYHRYQQKHDRTIEIPSLHITLELVDIFADNTE